MRDSPWRTSAPSSRGSSDLDGAAAADAPDGFYYRYWEHDDVFHRAPAHYGYRTGHHKLIYFYNDGLGLPGTGAFTYPGEWELYDLDVDPDEVHNVATDPAYEQVFTRMRIALRDAQLAVGDEPHPSEAAPIP